ncbi:MAG: Gldg family protein, partial [Anaerolineales bacterium]|nr:Gldg family protein [Anaerolineales bacterium]
ALLKVINPVEKKVYFITGHGERDSEGVAEDGLGTAVRLLQEAGFETDTLNLFTAGEIPADATAIAIIDQQTPMTDDEANAIAAYLDGGGTAFIAQDAIDRAGNVQTTTDALTTYLQDSWGVTFRPDFIIEQVFAQAGQSFGLTFLGASYGVGSITGGDLDQYGTVFDVARSIEITPPEGVTFTNLVLTSDQAWGETDLTNLAAGFAEPNDDVDAAGPLAIGSSLENANTNARLIVFGDTDFLSNLWLLQNGNSILMTNAFNWLADDELAVELTPRETITRQLTISQTQLGLIQLIVLALTPAIAALIGGAVWYSRRQTR